MKKLESKLDSAFDIILYTIIAISFLGTGVLITLEVIAGFDRNSNLIPIGVLLVVGMVLSGFLYWIKSQGETE